MNILIVDDNGTNRKLLRAQLEAEDHAILEAGDGVEALAVLDRERVDAVISDILMPNLDGFGLCLAVRKHARHSALPFVLYTSTYTSASDMQLARDVGANRFLTKPAPVPALIAALRDASFQTNPPVPLEPVIVLKQYNIALLRKLEDKENTLQRTEQKLARAHDRIAEPRRVLDRRIEKNTAEVSRLRSELHSAVTLVNQLSRLVPVCFTCKRIYDDQNKWQPVARYLASRGDARVGPGCCPECDAKHVAGLDKFLGTNSPPSS